MGSEDGNSIRFAPTFTKGCINEIDELIEDTGLFVGKADFLISALRFYSIHMMDTFSNAMKKLLIDGNVNMKSINLFKESTRALGQSFIQDFKNRYPDQPLNEQIGVRLPPNFVELLNFFDMLLQIGHIAIARKAVIEYLDQFRDEAAYIILQKEQSGRFNPFFPTDDSPDKEEIQKAVDSLKKDLERMGADVKVMDADKIIKKMS
jgi:hypothetical protein